MTRHALFIVALSAVLAVAAATTALAEPIDFSEVSLLVRAREGEASIRQEVTQRKLVRALSPQQEQTLKTQGASDALLQALRAPANILPQADATAYENRRNAQREQPAVGNRVSLHGGAEVRSDDVHIFEVAAGHPINLSRWGGPDYDLAFRRRTPLDDGREDAVIIDNTRSFTHAATYLGDGHVDNSTTMFERSNYVSVVNHTFTRALRIDRKNPVFMKGVPYALYPVYAAGGVSLYYNGSTTDSVKLAVSTGERY
jgi:hypothetical protein